LGHIVSVLKRSLLKKKKQKKKQKQKLIFPEPKSLKEHGNGKKCKTYFRKVTFFNEKVNI